ncbi:hypothetical protein [Streptococcus halotolerans]|uniref:hypothetical protein n=1 Tax=Streptococcus halotolerans TaxID=1814128 RepID=UPI0007868978|nr:hypothetical protein [Streptococcus halotolerans]
MKQEFCYYWEAFCLINAILCGALALTLLLFPDIVPTLGFSQVANFFTFPLVVNHKMKTKLRYRFLIAMASIFILSPIWDYLGITPIPLSVFPLCVASLLLAILALLNRFRGNF